MANLVFKIRFSDTVPDEFTPEMARHEANITKKEIDESNGYGLDDSSGTSITSVWLDDVDVTEA